MTSTCKVTLAWLGDSLAARNKLRLRYASQKKKNRTKNDKLALPDAPPGALSCTDIRDLD